MDELKTLAEWLKEKDMMQTAFCEDKLYKEEEIIELAKKRLLCYNKFYAK